MQAYSQDLRERVLWALASRGASGGHCAALRGQPVWVYRVRDREQKTGERTSFPIGGHRRSRLADMEPRPALLDQSRA